MLKSISVRCRVGRRTEVLNRRSPTDGDTNPRAASTVDVPICREGAEIGLSAVAAGKKGPGPWRAPRAGPRECHWGAINGLPILDRCVRNNLSPIAEFFSGCSILPNPIVHSNRLTVILVQFKALGCNANHIGTNAHPADCDRTGVSLEPGSPHSGFCAPPRQPGAAHLRRFPRGYPGRNRAPRSRSWSGRPPTAGSVCPAESPGGCAGEGYWPGHRTG